MTKYCNTEIKKYKGGAKNVNDRASIGFGTTIMTIGYTFLLKGTPESAAFVVLFAIGAGIVVYASVSRLLARLQK